MPAFVERVLQSLADAQVELGVAGALSAVLQGAPIVTQHLDLCYRRTPENVRRLARALAAFKPRLRGLPPDVPNIVDEGTLALGTNFTLEAEGESLDLLGEMSAIGGYDDVIGDAVELEVAGIHVRVLSLEHLIRSKRAAGRAKDLAVLPTLEATLEMLRDSGE